MKPEVRKTIQEIEAHAEAITASGRMLKFMEDTTVYDCPSWVGEYKTQANAVGLINSLLHSADAIHELLEQVEGEGDTECGQPLRSVGAAHG